jgi:hypothetical protein
MTRSLKKTYESHIRNILDVLVKKNINYKIFMHTWKTEKNMVWEEESNVAIDYTEYILLNPDEYQLDNQDDFLNSIRFEDYFDREKYELYGGDTHHEWRPGLVRNHLCALESQKRVTDMVLNDDSEYDYVMYIRPDVEIKNELEIELEDIKNKEIAIPDEDHCEGYNDKYAIMCYDDCSKYGKRIEEIKEFRKHERIVSEKYAKFIIDKYFTKVHLIPLHFQLIRP